MAELFMKETGTCKGAGGSMHIYDKATNFQGGWALVSEQVRNILICRLMLMIYFKATVRGWRRPVDIIRSAASSGDCSG